MARSRLPGFAALAVSLAAAAAACGSGGTGSDAAAGGTATASQLQAQYEQVVRTVLPSVVQISTPDSTGSGVVYDRKGDIVTNAHVVGDAKEVKVQESVGNHSYTGQVIGVFRPDDLAVVRVRADEHLKPARFANSANTQIGEIVLAMGNPLGLTDSVTQGIISATGRTVEAERGAGQPAITAAIQTSAAINPGNSGGALVNLDDEVVGVPTLTAELPDQRGAAPGIGFAIPSDTVQNIASQLIRSGKVVSSDRASLGISAQTAASPNGEPAGVAVLGVAARGSAAAAGIRRGDIIISVNGQRVSSLEGLEITLAGLKPGSLIRIGYTGGSGGAEKTGTARLGSLTSS